MMFRLKHIPSGFYFCPVREVKIHWIRPEDGREDYKFVKTNLSKNGKVYHKRPSFNYIGKEFYNHLHTQHKAATAYQISYHWLNVSVTPYIESEWEIEEIS